MCFIRVPSHKFYFYIVLLRFSLEYLGKLLNPVFGHILYINFNKGFKAHVNIVFF